MSVRRIIKPANDNGRSKDAVSYPLEKLYPLIELLALQAVQAERIQNAANDDVRVVPEMPNADEVQSGMGKTEGRR